MALDARFAREVLELASVIAGSKSREAAVGHISFGRGADVKKNCGGAAEEEERRREEEERERNNAVEEATPTEERLALLNEDNENLRRRRRFVRSASEQMSASPCLYGRRASRIPIRMIPSLAEQTADEQLCESDGMMLHRTECKQSPTSTNCSTSDSDSHNSMRTINSRHSLQFDFDHLHIGSSSSTIDLQADCTIFPVYTLTLSLSTFSEHLVFANVNGQSWLAGWSPQVERKTPQTLHTGDQVLEVNGERLEEGDIRSHVFKNVLPGSPIRLTMRTQPNKVEITLVKPINPCRRSLGINLHMGKNRIESVEEDSIAWQRGVPPELPSVRDPSTLVPSFITDLNGLRFNLWSRDDQFFKQLQYIRDGSEFTITLQPYDFIRSLKHSMKAQKKLYKAFCGM